MPFNYSFDRRSNSRAEISILHGDLMICCVVKNNMEARFQGSRISKIIKKIHYNGYRIRQNVQIYADDLEKHLFDAFFEWSGGEIEELVIHCGMCEELQNIDVDAFLAKLRGILSGRRIKVRMLRQQTDMGYSINSKFCEFFRNYVDFEMFGTIFGSLPSADPLIISEKMFKCELLFLDIRLANSEVLVERFEGWEIVLRQPDPNLNFDYMTGVFQKWYSGIDSHLEYLCLTLDISHESCKSLIFLGQIKEITKTGKTLTELEITRGDGKFCRFGRLPLKEKNEKKEKTGTVETNLIYFYVGECSDDLFRFNEFDNDIL